MVARNLPQQSSISLCRPTLANTCGTCRHDTCGAADDAPAAMSAGKIQFCLMVNVVTIHVCDMSGNMLGVGMRYAGFYAPKISNQSSSHACFD